MSYGGHHSQYWGPTSYAQHGDDFLILNLFRKMGIEKPTYLDLGANHPEHLSNTALLYQRGSRGVNVEANPDLIEELKQKRPDDTNLCLGVWHEEGLRDFFRLDPKSGLNSFCLEEIRSHTGAPLDSVLQLPVVSVDQIVEKWCGGVWPDLYCSDIEGADYNVIESASWTKEVNSPSIVVVETRMNETAAMKALMESKKWYLLYCRMGENLFFVRQRYWGMLGV